MRTKSFFENRKNQIIIAVVSLCCSFKSTSNAIAKKSRPRIVSHPLQPGLIREVEVVASLVETFEVFTVNFEG